MLLLIYDKLTIRVNFGSRGARWLQRKPCLVMKSYWMSDDKKG